MHRMRGITKYRGSKATLSKRVRRVVICTGMHDNAPVPLPQVTTSDYPERARKDLGLAVTRAREAAGWMRRRDLADQAKVSLRSLAKLEGGEPGVGRLVLEAVGRALPGWTEDSPWRILDGEPAPPTAPDEPPIGQSDEDAEEWTDEDESFFQALTEMLRPRGLKPTREIIQEMRRASEEDETHGDGAQKTG